MPCGPSKKAGVPVIAQRYLGTIHGFATLEALADCPPARAALSQSIAALRETFGAPPP